MTVSLEIRFPPRQPLLCIRGAPRAFLLGCAANPRTTHLKRFQVACRCDRWLQGLNVTTRVGTLLFGEWTFVCPAILEEGTRMSVSHGASIFASFDSDLFCFFFPISCFVSES